MNLNIAICDDEPKETKVIKSFLKTYEMQNDDNINVSVYDSAEALLDVYKEKHQFDILFLDVELPGMNGIQLAKRIRMFMDKRVKIIFISNYPEYMQESFEVQAFHYLKKPLGYRRFCTIMKRLTQEFSENVFSRILVENDEASVLVERSEIVYFEAVKGERNRLYLVTTSGDMVIRGSINEYEDSLKYQGFFSPHRSYLINMRYVHIIHKDRIVLDNNHVIPLSRRREKDIKNLFNRQILYVQQQNY